MYGINEKVYNNLIEYFTLNKYIKSVILFGSRAKGNERNNSDIDLCIDCVEDKRGSIEEKIDELIGIYSADILYLDSLNTEIKEQINKYGIIIYKRV